MVSEGCGRSPSALYTIPAIEGGKRNSLFVIRFEGCKTKHADFVSVLNELETVKLRSA